MLDTTNPLFFPLWENKGFFVLFGEIYVIEFQKFQLFQIKLGIPYYVSCPLTEFVCFLLFRKTCVLF